MLAHRPDDLEAVRDPLTDRERTVLAFLPSQRSSVEIAQDLAVSLNTIKTHQRAIYHKLGVGSRREAVARARTRRAHRRPADDLTPAGSPARVESAET